MFESSRILIQTIWLISILVKANVAPELFEIIKHYRNTEQKTRKRLIKYLLDFNNEVYK